MRERLQSNHVLCPTTSDRELQALIEYCKEVGLHGTTPVVRTLRPKECNENNKRIEIKGFSVNFTLNSYEAWTGIGPPFIPRISPIELVVRLEKRINGPIPKT